MPKALFSTDQEWFEFIQRCRTSGMNDKEFCREQGIFVRLAAYGKELYREEIKP